MWKITLYVHILGKSLSINGRNIWTLISNNFGRRKNNPAKDRKALETYVSLRGYKNGEIGNGREKDSQNGNVKLTLEEIAKQLGTSKTNLTRALRIERNLTDSIKKLLDTGEIKNERIHLQYRTNII